MITNINKVVRIGTVKTWERGVWVSVYCTITYKEGRLSVSGVMGPRAGGSATGGCGQIDMSFEHRVREDDDRRTTTPIPASSIRYAPGWSIEKWWDFLDMWKRWHLNDMKAGCEHQRAEKWGEKEVVLLQTCLNEWKIPQECKERDSYPYRLYEKVVIAAKRGEKYVPEGEAETSWFTGGVIEIKEERKTANWVKHTEHPEGVLNKPYPVCGYRYGSKWLREDVPQSVLEYVQNLPDTDVQPAWV